MSTVLVKYEAARYALQIASQVDEVKDIRDKAQAMLAYARQAKDETLIKSATDIKLRAERRCGEMLAETERNNGGNPHLMPTSSIVLPVRNPTLDELGLSKQQSSDFQAVASIPEEIFEKELASGKASTRSLVRKSPKAKQAAATKQPKPAKKAKPAKPEPSKDELTEMGHALEEADKTIREQQELIDSLKKSDLGAEIEKWKLKFDKLNGRLQQCVTTKNEAERQAKYSTGLLAKIRKALKIEKNTEILEAIADLKR